MKRYSIFLVMLATPFLCLAQSEMAGTDEASLIESALSAAPASIAEGATIMDLEQNVIREGTNGFTCLPDDPNEPGNAPACLDAEWLRFFDAWQNKQYYEPSGLGIAYMLAGGGPESNTDPYAERPTASNEWMAKTGPHIMIIAPEQSQLRGMSTDPTSGEPWVMWRRTHLAHVMIPVDGK